MEEVEGKIEDAARNGLPIHQDMLFEQMPAARSHKQRGRLLIESILLAIWIAKCNCAVDGITYIDLTLNRAFPGGGKRIFKIGHKDFRPRVQGIDHHFALDRAGDLDAPVL